MDMPSDHYAPIIESFRRGVDYSLRRVLATSQQNELSERPNLTDLAERPYDDLNGKFFKKIKIVDKNSLNHPPALALEIPGKSSGKSDIVWKKYDVDREEEKRKFAEKCSNACNFWDSFGKGTRKAQEMVRVGEFSPQNPNLQTTGRSLLGLGEYEERRRQLLQKKREEYHQELAQIAQAQKISTNQSVSPVNPQKSTRDCCTQTDLSLLTPGQPLSVDVQSSNSAPMKGNSLFNVEASQLLSEVPGLNIVSPRSLSPSSPERRRLDLPLPSDLSEARLRQLRHQEDLRRQIEEKQRIEAERREKEAKEEEALARRVAEQQARLQAEFEEEERLRRKKELEKQFQTEEFLRRQEQLLLESEQLKLEQRRKRMEALTALAEPQSLSSPPAQLLPNPKTLEKKEESAAPTQEQGSHKQEHAKESKKASKGTAKNERPGRNAHLVPPGTAAPISILKPTSPPPRSPREPVSVRDDLEPPSPRALIKILEGPTLRRPRNQVSLEDSLPIPLMRQTRTRTPSPCQRTNPPQRFPPVHSSRSNPNSAILQPSEAMQRLEDKWKVPAVQKNVMTKRKAGQWGDSSESHTVLTQLGSFRRQLQEEHMRMKEKIRDCERQPRLEEKSPDSDRNPVS